MSLACHWTEKSVLDLLCLSVTLLEQVVLKISIICGFTQGTDIPPKSVTLSSFTCPLSNTPQQTRIKQKANYVILGFLCFLFFFCCFFVGGGSCQLYKAAVSQMIYNFMPNILGDDQHGGCSRFSQNQNWHFPFFKWKENKNLSAAFLTFKSFMKPSSEPLGDQWETLGPTTRQG